MKRILVLPGWMTELQFYNPANNFQLQFGKIDLPIEDDDVVIGISLGALVVLRESSRIPGKIILINPPLPRRNIFVWLYRLMQMMAHETPFNGRQKFTHNPFRFLIEIVRCVALLSANFDATLTALPKERLTVIRGKQDRFFADELTVRYLRVKGVTVIETESGHNWSEAIEASL
jgi:hypothetical protein